MFKKCTFFLPLILTGCVGPFIAGGVGSLGMHAVEDRGFSGSISDQALRVKLNFALSDFSGYELTVYKGRVLLTGVVANEKVKAEIVRLSKTVSGVKEIIDRMNVQGSDGFAEYARDGWMTTKLKAALYANDDVIAPNYLVTTFDKVIYIFGTAQTKEEMDLVLADAFNITGVRKVVNLIEVKNPASLRQ